MQIDIETIRQRARLCRAIRNHFTEKGYLEVETPVLADGLIPEPAIEVFETRFSHPFLGSAPRWLVPSPEVHMKQLLAAGSGSIFQISKCFRNSEQVGRWHNPEFTMLEWYTAGADSTDSIGHTEELIAAAAPAGTPDHLLPPFRVVTMRDLFRTHVSIDLDAVVEFGALRSAALSLGLAVPAASETWESLFNRIFLTFIEPEIPQDRPLVITEYPAKIPCLAADIPGTPYKQRWELYAGGVELANCYTEETDPERTAAFLREEYRRLTLRAKHADAVIPDISEEFSALFAREETLLPPCSGTALGVDRLLMLFGGHKAIGGVILFPHSDIVR